MKSMVDMKAIEAVRNLNIMLDLINRGEVEIVDTKETYKQISPNTSKGSITFKYVRQHEFV